MQTFNKDVAFLQQEYSVKELEVTLVDVPRLYDVKVILSEGEKPKYEILELYLNNYNLPTESLIKVLKKINKAIDDQNYEIGISFFMKDEKNLKELLPSIWKSEIEPYLEEYFYDQPGKVQAFRWEKLVNDELKDWIK